MNRLGVVIVTYNSQAAIGACLQSVARQDRDVVVVDNASTDRTVDAVGDWSGVELIANMTNLGFAGGANQGVAALDNELVLLLNPDTILLTEIDRLRESFHDQRVGAAAGKLVDEDGVPQAGFSVRRFPTVAALAFEVLGLNRIWRSNPVNRRYRCLNLDLEAPADVEQPAGAFLMIRRDVWNKLGGMDPEFYPVWFDDVDYLRRLHREGYRVRYEPAAIAQHLGGHSVNALADGCRQLYWYGSLLRYAAKHLSPLGGRLVCVAVVAGVLLRMVASVVLRRSMHPFVVYGRVFRLALGFLLTGRVGGVRRLAAAGTTS